MSHEPGTINNLLINELLDYILYYVLCIFRLGGLHLPLSGPLTPPLFLDKSAILRFTSENTTFWKLGAVRWRKYVVRPYCSVL